MFAERWHLIHQASLLNLSVFYQCLVPFVPSFSPYYSSPCPPFLSFIVLEFLGGGTLRSRLDSCGGGLGIKPAVKYGHQLASALAYMHDEAVPGM